LTQGSSLPPTSGTPPSSEVPDVDALRSEDGEGFAVLFDRYWADVVGFIDRRRPHEPAVDLAAEVFRIAFERRHRFQAEHDTVRPWLFGIATNLLRADRRRSGRRARAVRRLAGRAAVEAAGVADFTTQADRALDAATVAPALRRALLALRSDDRAVLLLVCWDGLSYDEVAALQHVPVGTARSRAHRARTQLRVALAETGEAHASGGG
jgi:RNA polymerase sigma-70 factor (ECF subfamily)